MSRKLVERVSETPNPCAPDPISADELRSGSWLLRVARSNFQRFGEIAETSVYPTLTRLTWGSLCSGSEGVYFVMQAINAAVDAAWQDFVLEHKFSCEIVPDKRCWIEAVAECGPAALKHLQQQGRSNTKQKAWDDGKVANRVKLRMMLKISISILTFSKHPLTRRRCLAGSATSLTWGTACPSARRTGTNALSRTSTFWSWALHVVI